MPNNQWQKKRYYFENGYGASVIRTPTSLGGPEGYFELAVLKDGNITYDTAITDDVIGWLTQEQVNELLKQIEAL